MKENFKTLRLRLFLSTFTLGILGIGLIFGFFAYLLQKLTVQDIQSNASYMMKAVQVVGGDQFAEFLEIPVDNENSNEFNSLNETMDELFQAVPEIWTLSVYKVDGGVWEEVVTRQGRGEFEYIGKEIPISDVLDPLGNDPSFTEIQISNVFTDRGYYLSVYGYLPVFNHNGFLTGIVSIEFKINNMATLYTRLITPATVFLVVLIVVSAIGAWLLALMVTVPIKNLTHDIQKLSVDSLRLHNLAYSYVELSDLADAVNHVTQVKQGDITETNLQLNARNTELELWRKYLDAAICVTQTAASNFHHASMIQKVVESIRDEFSFYFVGLYLFDAAHDYAYLRAGTGRPGKVLLARKHRIRNGEGFVGWVLSHGEARVSTEISKDATRSVSLELPLTRSLAVFPLLANGKNLGALSIHSEQVERFNPVLTEVVGQLSMILAMLFDISKAFIESGEEIHAMHDSMQKLSRQTWIDFLKDRTFLGYKATEFGISDVQPDNLATYRERIKQGLAVYDPSEVVIPIEIRGQKIGLLHARKPILSSGESNPWSEQEKKIIQDLIERLSITLDNARLYEAAKQSAGREKMLSDITLQVRSSTDVNTILRTAIRELAEALQVPRGSITFRTAEESSGESEN